MCGAFMAGGERADTNAIKFFFIALHLEDYKGVCEKVLCYFSSFFFLSLSHPLSHSTNITTLYVGS